MLVDGIPRRTIWMHNDAGDVGIIDQTMLPHAFDVRILRTMPEAAQAISTMAVRGAPLIGATAAYGMALQTRVDASDAALRQAYATLHATRPTAVNLRWALDDMLARLQPLAPEARRAAAYERAGAICDSEVEICRRIGAHALPILQELATQHPDRPINVLTHCNAGWLAGVDWGMATAPIYAAQEAGLPVHVWVDETRPRNQGASLTAWELDQQGIPHTIIVDNAGGHLMQHGEVDLCITGTDRTTSTGDVANKIGTYLKALAAHANDVPFYVALPSTTIDWTLEDGVRDIPIEQRDAREVTHITGEDAEGALRTVALTPSASPAANYAFDVTPARYITGLITERGIAAASREGLLALFPEQRA